MFLSSFAQNPFPKTLPNVKKKNGTGVRLAPAKPRKSRDKDSHEEAGADNQDTEDNHAEDHDVFEDQESPTDDMTSLQDAAGSASTTSRSTEETPYYQCLP